MRPVLFRAVFGVPPGTAPCLPDLYSLAVAGDDVRFVGVAVVHPGADRSVGGASSR